jgi:hypothetical protein
MPKKTKQEKQKNITIDDLAIIIKKSFDVVDKRFDDVDKRFSAVDKRFDTVERRFENIDNRLNNLELGQKEIIEQLKKVAFRYGIEFVESRLARLELEVFNKA